MDFKKRGASNAGVFGVYVVIVVAVFVGVIGFSVVSVIAVRVVGVFGFFVVGVIAVRVVGVFAVFVVNVPRFIVSRGMVFSAKGKVRDGASDQEEKENGDGDKRGRILGVVFLLFGHSTAQFLY